MMTASTGNMTMRDQERLNDFIASQKQIGMSYQIFAGECANTQLRDTFLNILNEEHQIQTDLFNQARNRGWYQVPPADASKVQQAYQKFSNPNA
ncbi:MAG: spore coat protein [Oscillospiraceae bacterium]|nr:spore coat protein [Oscillospiraceae bacterium]